MAPQNMDPNALLLNAPNTFSLSGHGVTVEYDSTSINGKAQLSYKDANGENNFAENDFTVEETQLGILVTCVTKILVDVGSNSFTFVIPRVDVQQGQEQKFETIGIQTYNTNMLVHAGAKQTYTVIKLSGTARFVAS